MLTNQFYKSSTTFKKTFHSFKFPAFIFSCVLFADVTKSEACWNVWFQFHVLFWAIKLMRTNKRTQMHSINRIEFNLKIPGILFRFVCFDSFPFDLWRESIDKLLLQINGWQIKWRRISGSRNYKSQLTKQINKNSKEIYL